MDDAQEVAECPRKYVNLAGRVSEPSRSTDEAGKQTEGFRTAYKPGYFHGAGRLGRESGHPRADKPVKNSVLGRLKEAKQWIGAGHGNRQKTVKKKEQEL